MKKLDLKTSAKKIDSPLAKYNSTGQLFCVLCNVPVKSDMFWTGHVNGRSHQEALQQLNTKKRPADSTQDEPSAKRKAAVAMAVTSAPRGPPEVDTKKATDTFKVPFPVSTTPPVTRPRPIIPEHPGPSSTFLSQKETKMEVEEADEEDDEYEQQGNNSTEVNETSVNGINLPEGFFDDPKADAKIRGKEWRDPDELEWERFTKEIANEELKSSSLRSQDEEDSTKTRELEEIEEQMAHWQKVIDLERKAEEAKKLKKLNESKAMMLDDDEDVEEYDEEMDWRSKRH